MAEDEHISFADIQRLLPPSLMLETKLQEKSMPKINTIIADLVTNKRLTLKQAHAIHCAIEYACSNASFVSFAGTYGRDGLLEVIDENETKLLTQG